MGFADVYERYRPTPPAVIVDLLTQLAGIERANHVIDIGCGTGLSTLIWRDRTNSLTGVEPSPNMLAIARDRPEWQSTTAHVQFVAAEAHLTGLADGCADIVTASQSFHWMEPASTLKEAARILRPGGVFAAYDCDWPPIADPVAESAFTACSVQANELLAKSAASKAKAWPKEDHLAQIRDSGYFNYAREIACHAIDSGDAERFVGLAKSQGYITTLLKAGYREPEIGLDQFEAVVRRRLGRETIRWFWCYRIRLGIKPQD